jgi:Ca2+-binding EF-hand superfamily protein
VGFLRSWRSFFDRFDQDRSRTIKQEEYSEALKVFGYCVTKKFETFLFYRFDKAKKGQLNFDLFVQACLKLMRATDVFKEHDNDRDRYITLSFDESVMERLG